MTHHHHTEENSQPSWASPAGQYPGQAPQWQGQAGPYYDPAQHYYDPNNPTAWQQATQYPGHAPKKPVYKQWWFITILAVLALGAVAIVLALASTGGNADDDVAEQQGPEAPAAPPVSEDFAQLEDSRVQRSDDGQFVLEDGGTEAEALALAQDRIDAGYSYYGPADLIDFLRYDGYQNQAIEYALNNLSVDWNEQAMGVAQQMGDSEYSGYSATAIQQHLTRTGFTEDEVQYAMDNVDIDFNEQALKALESYQDILSDRSDDELRDYLEHEGFQESEIDHAFDNID